MPPAEWILPQTLAQISYKIHAEQEAATVSSAFTLWLVKTRGGQLLDRKEISHTRRAFNVWKEKTHRIQKLNGEGLVRLGHP